jgi:hypothetical protein
MLTFLKRAANTVTAAAAGKVRMFVDSADGFFKTVDETGTVKTIGGVQTFNGRSGAVVPLQADYDAFFTTTAEAAAAAPVQSVAGKTGAVTLDTSNVAENAANLYYTNARASAAAPVQSVAGRAGAVTLSTTDVAEGTNLYYTDVRARASRVASRLATAFTTTANSAVAQNVITLVVPAVRIAAGLTLEVAVFGVQTNAATSGGNNNVIITLNGTAVATATVAVGATAQTNRAFRAIGTVSFQSTTLVYASVEQAITTIAAVSASNGAAGTTVAAGDVTIGVQLQTATANAGNTIKAVTAYIAEV